MFGLFERGKNSGSFSTILLLAILAIAFFSQSGNRGQMRSSTANNDDTGGQDAAENDGVTILYSRVLGTMENIPEKKVLEVVAEEKPETKAQVRFSRIVGKDKETKDPVNILYSRTV
ncbi:MAG: hypothetical protein ACOYJ1_07185 [Peptococcales bacterium]|jgi:hypothetical protein